MVSVAGGVVISVGVAIRVNELGDLRFWGVVGVSKEVGGGTGILGIMFCNFLEFVSKIKGFLNLIAFGC